MSPSTRSKSAKKEPFSLVPFAVQRRLYELVLRSILVREHLGLTDRLHTDFAEIGAIAALADSDPVFPAPHSIGARVVRATELSDIEAQLAQQPHAHLSKVSSDRSAAQALLTSIVTGLLDDPKRFAVVPTTEIADKLWQEVLRLAGRHRLPILFIVPGRIEAKRKPGSDLRTIYAEFGVPVMTVDANDPVAAYRVATEAAHNARAGRGATVLEAATVDTANSQINSQHPLEHLEEYMRRRGSWNDDWRTEIEAAAQAAMRKVLTA